eukprot:TRINITY_DN5133_c0_g2_i1.p1 TRINITY_DN5133_c0_g2~~TRINITY_DN5133_c0_g2_i1.p1  ORF type:complete len:326 (+),score=67.49 TRINITY_DN5133_c0_g2_i1:90-1067(+)
MSGNQMDDLLGAPMTGNQYAHQQYVPTGEYFATPAAPPPGATVDLSGSSSRPSAGQPSSFRPASNGFSSSSSSGSSSFSSSSMGGAGGFAPRGPTSIEGGGGSGLSLSSLNPQQVLRQLASRPLTEVVAEQSRNLLQIPQAMGRAYTAAARRYLRPWNEFLRLNPARIVEGVRGASRRGEIQIYFQRNVISNARQFCPNYVFIFMAFLFMYVCTSPMLLMMLAGVGGGWGHALRSDEFRTRPWTLQIGGISVPLGGNMKMAIMAAPTLLFLHFFMGPVLWSAALMSGGVSLAHAALRDRDDPDKFDDGDDGDHGLGPPGRVRELP